MRRTIQVDGIPATVDTSDQPTAQEMAGLVHQIRQMRQEAVRRDPSLIQKIAKMMPMPGGTPGVMQQATQEASRVTPQEGAKATRTAAGRAVQAQAEKAMNFLPSQAAKVDAALNRSEPDYYKQREKRLGLKPGNWGEQLAGVGQYMAPVLGEAAIGTLVAHNVGTGLAEGGRAAAKEAALQFGPMFVLHYGGPLIQRFGPQLRDIGAYVKDGKYPSAAKRAILDLEAQGVHPDRIRKTFGDSPKVAEVLDRSGERRAFAKAGVKMDEQGRPTVHVKAKGLVRPVEDRIPESRATGVRTQPISESPLPHSTGEPDAVQEQATGAMGVRNASAVGKEVGRPHEPVVPPETGQAQEAKGQEEGPRQAPDLTPLERVHPEDPRLDPFADEYDPRLTSAAYEHAFGTKPSGKYGEPTSEEAVKLRDRLYNNLQRHEPEDLSLTEEHKPTLEEMAGPDPDARNPDKRKGYYFRAYRARKTGKLAVDRRQPTQFVNLSTALPHELRHQLYNYALEHTTAGDKWVEENELNRAMSQGTKPKVRTGAEIISAEQDANAPEEIHHRTLVPKPAVRDFLLDHATRMQSNWTKIADRKMGEDPEALRRAVAHYADRVPGSVSSEAPVSTRASVSTSPQSQFTPPEGSTGLANQVQTREIESGLLSREPEKGDTMSRRDIHAMGAAMPSVEEAEKLGKRIASGSEPFNRRSVALAQEGKRLFVKQLKDARRETSQAIERGEPPEAVNGLRDHVAALEKRLGDYLDDIQKGKTGWAQTGHALQIGTKVDTGEYDDVIQAAQTAKGSKLTDAEKQRYREAVDELNDLKERHAKLGAENEKQSSRIANLEKALAKETRAAKSFPKARVSVRRTQGAKLIQEGKDDFRKAIANISFGSTGGGRQRGATVLPIPENTPEILEAVGKITKGVIQSGVGTLEDVYAKVNEALAEHGYSATKEQIHAAFAKVASRVGAMSEDQRRRAALSTMLRLHAKIDEALSGAAKDPEKAARMAADPEIVELREQLKSLQGGDPIEKSFQDKLDAALKRLAKPKVPRSDVQGPPTEKAAAIKKELDDLRSGLARDRRTSGLKKKLAELDAKIKTRDTSKSPRNQPQFTGDQERLRQEIKTKQKQIEAMIEADRKQTTAERVGGYVQRAVITRIPTLGKLLSASAWHHPVEAINDAMGYATSKLPAGGGKTLGELNPSAAGGGATTARLKSLASPRLNWTRALPSLRGGINEIDAAAGKIYGGRLAPIRTMGQKAKLAATDLLVHPERLHAGEKAMTIQGPQFDAALRREMSYAKAHGIEPTPGNIDAMRNRAALEAQNAILRSDNKAANFVNRNIESALRSKHVGERAAGLVGRLVFPITRMGFNFASETAQLTGIPQIEMAIGHAVKVGIMKKEITPEEAAVLGRAYKRLGPAAVALYIAATQPKWFQVGKFYQGPPKKGEPTEDLAPGEVRLFGVKMPRVFTHSPFVYSVMFWSTLLHGKGDLEKRAGNTALGASEAIPGEMAISEGSRDVEAGNPHLGRAIARIAEPAIPGILQQAAESSDMQQGSALGHMFLGTGHPRKRDTTAYWGAGQIMSEIPGLRGKVPEEGPKKPPKRRPPKLRVH